MKSIFALGLAVALTGCQQSAQYADRATNQIAEDIVRQQSPRDTRPYDPRRHMVDPETERRLQEVLDRMNREHERSRLEDENRRLRDELDRNRWNRSLTVATKGKSIRSVVAETYGIRESAAGKVLGLIEAGYKGDTAAFAAIGLDQRTLRAAKQNGGRLQQDELARVSAALGIPAAKLDRLVQRWVR